jgi:ABC transporter substrate binding protein (PQQ-dependent alcohol dehydrogenase system)
MRIFLFFVSLLLLSANVSQSSESQRLIKLHIIYAEQKIERPPRLSGLHPWPDDLGLAGAKLGIKDNQTTGKFLNQSFEFEEVIAKPGEHLSAAIEPKLQGGADLVIVNAPAAELLAIADLPAAKNIMIFNVAARDENLREEHCRSNVLHTMPTRSMLTDALAQFFVKKQWPKWLLIAGDSNDDIAYANAVRNSAKKFGLSIVDEKNWATDSDLRENAATEVPLMTQDADYDAIVVADENDDFGPSIALNSWLPRPVAGTHGLVATSWSDVIEPWGAIQLQNRFHGVSARPMRDVDFAAYIAVRIIGEAVTRTGKIDVPTMRKFILSDALQMSAFKGRGLTFRPWNGQLRQPIHLVTSDAQVAVAPLEGFLHQVNELDTLGVDQPETKCVNFKAGEQQ